MTPLVLFVGRTTLDALYLLDEMPREDTKVFARAFRVVPGGPACNASITHAQMGGRAILLSAVGRGIMADVARGELNRRAIRLIDLAAAADYETPLTAVLVNSEEAKRTIVNPPAEQFEIGTLPPDWPAAWGDPPHLVLTDGFYLSETLPLLASLRDAGCSICFDGGSWKPGTDHLAPLLRVAICSERFAVPGKPADAETTLAWFADQGVPFAAVTRGAQSIIAADCGRRFEIEVEKVEVEDTLGAGDVLHGALCFYLASGHGFEDALQRAAKIATRSCCGMGITAWQESDPHQR